MGTDSWDPDSLYTEDQAEEIARTWEANPAKGRTPKTLVGKVQTLRKRGVAINVPPFSHGLSDLSEVILSGNIASEAHIDWRNERISKCLRKANMAAGQRAAARGKREKTKALVDSYIEVHDIPNGIKPLATRVADWAIQSGLVQRSGRRNLTRRLRYSGYAT